MSESIVQSPVTSRYITAPSVEELKIFAKAERLRRFGEEVSQSVLKAAVKGASFTEVELCITNIDEKSLEILRSELLELGYKAWGTVNKNGSFYTLRVEW